MRYYLYRHRKLFLEKTFAGLQNSWQIWNYQISRITATTELTTCWNRTSYKTWTSWNVDPSLADVYQKQATKIQSPPMASSTHVALFGFIEESNEVEVVFYCNACFVWELTIVASHRPPWSPNCNLESSRIQDPQSMVQVTVLDVQTCIDLPS